MTAPDRTAGRVALVGAELGLLVLALGVAASFTRLFVGWDWLVELAVPVCVAWGIGVATRRAGLGVSASIAVQAGVGVLVLSWLFAPGTLLVVLPTPATWRSIVDQVTTSFSSFSELVAPVPADPGFLVVVAAALWVIACFADTAAIRFRAPVQAGVPYVATFAAVGILARDSGRTMAAILVAGAIALYGATQQALAATERRWVAGRTARGARAVFASTLAVALVAVLGGLFLGPRLPGSTEPVVDLRELGQGDGPRTVVSPFVGIRSLLGERSDQVMFTVEADAPAYWRLTALERYDPTREIWVSRGSYQRTDGRLPSTMAADVGGARLEQSYRIDGLATTWLPAAYVPRLVDSDADLSFDSVSSSLILRDPGEGDRLAYRLESVLPDVASLLAGGATEPPVDLDEEYLRDPQLDPDIAAGVAALVAGETDPYRRMLALQNWFRSEFTYDDGVDFSDEPDAVRAFLDDRRGFCQQFASTFALFARSLGVPSRVAVGFTQGDAVAGRGDDPAAEFVVRGRHAHAWPEVYFDGIGWVPFEPTPQRGNPQAQEYTGVAPAQATAPPQQAATTTTSSPAPPTTASAPTTTPSELDATAVPEPPEDPSDGGDRGWQLGIAMVLAAIAVVAVTAAVIVRRGAGGHRNDRAGRSAAVAAAWNDAVRALALIDLRPAASETPLEFARRADTLVGRALVTPLARLETRRRFAAGAPSPEAVDGARSMAQQVVDHVRGTTTRRQRLTGSVGR